jgi:uncharacterized membrane protein
MITMIILLIILVVTFIFILVAGLVFLQMFSPKKAALQTKPDDQTPPVEKSESKAGVRWSYFILPVVILLISVIITIYFYGKLPDAVAWRLNSVDSPAISRFQIVLWAIVPQLLLTLLAMVITYGTTKIAGLLNQAPSDGIRLGTVLMVMSNMVVIPQLILIIAMLRIFSYNSFQTHIGFVWWVYLAIIIAGIVLLSIFFVRALRKMGNQDK